MDNQNPKAKKAFVRIVGIAAAVAIIFLGTTGKKPTTFLGGVEPEEVVSLSSLKISPETTLAVKGKPFSADVVLHVGKEVPQSIDVKISYDPDVVTPVYVDTLSASFSGVMQHYSLDRNGGVRIFGTFSSPLHEGQDLVIGKIYFHTLQNIGTSRLVIQKQGSSVLDADGQPLLGETRDGNFTIKIQ